MGRVVLQYNHCTCDTVRVLGAKALKQAQGRTRARRRQAAGAGGMGVRERRASDRRAGRTRSGSWARGLGAGRAAWARGLALGCALGALGLFSIRFDLVFFLSHQMNTVHCKRNFSKKKIYILNLIKIK